MLINGQLRLVNQEQMRAAQGFEEWIPDDAAVKHLKQAENLWKDELISDARERGPDESEPRQPDVLHDPYMDDGLLDNDLPQTAETPSGNDLPQTIDETFAEAEDNARWLEATTQESLRRGGNPNGVCRHCGYSVSEPHASGAEDAALHWQPILNRHPEPSSL